MLIIYAHSLYLAIRNTRKYETRYPFLSLDVASKNVRILIRRRIVKIQNSRYTKLRRN